MSRLRIEAEGGALWIIAGDKGLAGRDPGGLEGESVALTNVGDSRVEVGDTKEVEPLGVDAGLLIDEDGIGGRPAEELLVERGGSDGVRAVVHVPNDIDSSIILRKSQDRPKRVANNDIVLTARTQLSYLRQRFLD